MTNVGMPEACKTCKRKCPFADAPIEYRQICLFVPHNDAFNAQDELNISQGFPPLTIDRAQFLALDWQMNQRIGIDSEKLANEKEFKYCSFGDAISNEFFFCENRQ